MTPRPLSWIAAVALVATGSSHRGAAACPDGSGGHAAVLRALPSAKHSLLDGVLAVSKGDAVVISAKFEDEGKGLSLSVYTAGGGLAPDAEQNELQEHAGDPTTTEWKPTTVVFEDRAHVARASEHLTLMRLAKLSIADVIRKVGAAPGATVFSVTPEMRDGRGVFAVLAAVGGEVVAEALDLATGEPVAGAWPRALRAPEPTPLVGKTLSGPTVGNGAAWISAAPSPLPEAVAKRVVLVASNSYG